MLPNQKFTKFSSFVAAMFLLFMTLGVGDGIAFVPGGTLDPTTITKYQRPLLVPPVMPKTDTLPGGIDYYEIAVRQFDQEVAPGLMTTVWGYGSVNHPDTFSYPAYTIEATVNKPVRVKWINDLKDPDTGEFLPHLLPVDQTLHWANPPQDCIDGMMKTDCRGQSQERYTGPVPIITHLHGAHVQPDSDGYPEAWFLPDAANIPDGYATRGSRFGQIPGASDEAGAALFQYRNDQRATTLWFHDHTLGMTRANVYAGPAGFYILRGGSSDLSCLLLPGPAPKAGDDPGKKYHEIPIIIQDRSFNENGSLFYPDNRAFFEGLNFLTHPDPQFPGAGDLIVPFIPDTAASGGRSDVSPIWNPEFFGNTMVVNGKTWPVLEVEKMRYRFRFLNASDSRFLILKMVSDPLADRPVTSALPFWQIGTDGGFLPSKLKQDTLLLALAERADVIVDFSHTPVGTEIYLINEAPDEPFGGGVPFTGCDPAADPPVGPPDCFEPSDPATTGQVMKFVVKPRQSIDLSLPPKILPLPDLKPLGKANKTRRLSLNEDSSSTVFVSEDVNGNIIEDLNGVAFGPTSARLGTLGPDGFPVPKSWMDDISENPKLGATETWELYNFTADAHPIHVHQTMFQVVNRQDLVTDADGMSEPPARPVAGTVKGPEPWEMGFKDTVISYPGQVTRIKVFFDIKGLYVWHCHILSHEDNEMMRPFCVGNEPCLPPMQP
ncbi:MAG: multicopper oxidase domain-containing protein [Nitrospirae bacterium]|nr:multicopper oxidase domain-containing protein [Nitrospirota bacterium]